MGAISSSALTKRGLPALSVIGTCLILYFLAKDNDKLYSDLDTSFIPGLDRTGSGSTPFIIPVEDLPGIIMPLDPMLHMPAPPLGTQGTIVPNIVHYVFISGKKAPKLKYYAYLAIQSAIIHLHPSKIYLHHDHLPTGPSWDEISSRITTIQHTIPKRVYRHKFRYTEHKSDVIRLLALNSSGGIYLDSDMFVLRPFDDLMQAPVTMALEAHEKGGYNGVCNAMILSRPGSSFIKRWIDSYMLYNGVWSFNSVVIPWQLARSHPEEIQVLDVHAAFWPSWDPQNIERVFNEDNYNFTATRQYAYHAWSQKSAHHLDTLTYHDIMTRNTSFNRIARTLMGERDAEIFKTIKETPQWLLVA